VVRIDCYPIKRVFIFRWGRRKKNKKKEIKQKRTSEIKKHFDYYISTQHLIAVVRAWF
jgi:hypothetical protein